ncbi:MAG: glycosyltransferase family 1 protein [Nostocales cyanobacterium ELA583]|jgi:glycosyltransferase involved in cell wall biosynthesis
MYYTKDQMMPKGSENHRLTEQHPIRILHVVGGMNRGGAETWLMHVLRNIDRDRFQMDFLVHTNEPCAYDDEIRSLGSQIIPCLEPSKPWLYARNFQRILSEYGPYQIVHSHVHHFSGYVLRLAEQAGVPIRIAHSHLDSSALEANKGIHRQSYLLLMKSLIKRHSTIGLGCSKVANADLFGQNWTKDSHWQILCYGINLTPFQQPIDSFEVRDELNIPPDAFVIGHVGRFEKQKNHQFLLQIFADVLKKERQAYLLLLGEGSLRAKITQQVKDISITDRVVFAGSRSDVPRLMRGAMDVFLFPSLCEGLPLVLIEAQAAGLSCIFSDVVTEEVDVIQPLMQRVSLSHSPSIWSKEVLAARNIKANIKQKDCLDVLENRDFNITNSVKVLTEVYEYKGH